MATSAQKGIDSNTTVNDVLAILPEASGILADLGLDTCCGGSLTLAESCSDAGVDLAAVLAKFAALAPRAE